MIEWNLIAKEEGLVRGHRLDHIDRNGLGAILDFLNEITDA